jgi:hypothetical protein
VEEVSLRVADLVIGFEIHAADRITVNVSFAKSSSRAFIRSKHSTATPEVKATLPSLLQLSIVTSTSSRYGNVMFIVRSLTLMGTADCL